MSSLTYGQLVCAICHAELLQHPSEAAELTCAGCCQPYIVFAGRIPLILPDSVSYRVNTYWQYNKYLRETEATLAKLRQNSAQPWAAARAQYLREALTTNAVYIARIQQQLAASLPPELLLARPADKLRSLAYLSSFSYLKRDWCGLPEDEQELQTIIGAVRAGLPTTSQPGQALVLGAGTARVAAMLKDDFEQVYAIDLSLTMAWQYHNLAEQGAVRFYDIQSKNARSLAEQATEHWATANLVPNLAPDSLQYWVADVKQIPLPTNSVAAVVSVYFTDTVPLHEYLGEVKRVLRPGGVFINFGPLEYHFTDISAHLSAEEVRSVFESYGFRVVQEQEVTTSHLLRPASLAYKTYHNWFFSAVLTAEDEAASQTITDRAPRAAVSSLL
ncbi:class I SAM-dependent methyltransferase [Hymenobacter elongatus]|uniref:carnosine N-methyltransferase n=1 Tax=Hymenobacter elongatus TaxID=877208 RepID=A0A4Z0PE43_9BACT|nr:class I SAM-dependent methyltransferase [Hymenobacter elongatus]TGE11893.1 methyltransferase domain-containing protein [Hymenobacter elongatus]